MKTIFLVLVTVLSFSAVAKGLPAIEKSKITDEGELGDSAYFFGPRGYITSARVVRDPGANNFVFRIVWRDDNGVEQIAAENDQWLLTVESVRNVKVDVDMLGMLRFVVKSEAPDIVEWDYTIGVSFLGGQYVVTEYWRNSNGSPELGIPAESCTYNMRSGEGIRNGRMVKVVDHPIPVDQFGIAYFADCDGLRAKARKPQKPKPDSIEFLLE